MFPTEPVPERIGTYKVLRRLSGAGSADVYVGRAEGPMGFSRLCTLKLVPNTIEGDERFREELGREAAITATLNHPAIQRMIDFFEHDKHLVLVLEHVEGTSLERLLSHLGRRQKKLGDGAFAFVGREIAGALAHAHAVKDDDRKPTPVIHRNLSFENVIIGWDGQVRLSGFGLGKILGRTPDTVAGMVKSAAEFMAPEQLRGERVTPKADVYGLGLLLWSLFSGQKPPDDGTRPQSLAKLRPDMYRDLAQAIDRSLELSLDKRTITCADLARHLDRVPGIEKGRDELGEKALLLRGPQQTTSETAVRPTRGSAPRRRVPLDAVRPSKPVESSQKRLSVPAPPASRPGGLPSERPGPGPRISERPAGGGGILDEDSPQSVFPILRALADRVPKPQIPGPPPMPKAEAKPAGKPEAQVPKAVLPSAGKVLEKGPAKPSVAAPLGSQVKDEWKISVPDEELLDKLFDEATSRTGIALADLGVGTDPRVPKTEAELAGKEESKKKTEEKPAEELKQPEPKTGRMQFADTEPELQPLAAPEQPSKATAPAPPLPAQGKASTNVPKAPPVAPPMAPPIAPPMTPMAPPVAPPMTPPVAPPRFGPPPPPAGTAATPLPSAAAPITAPSPRFGPPPPTAATPAPPTPAPAPVAPAPVAPAPVAVQAIAPAPVVLGFAPPVLASETGQTPAPFVEATLAKKSRRKQRPKTLSLIVAGSAAGLCAAAVVLFMLREPSNGDARPASSATAAASAMQAPSAEPTASSTSSPADTTPKTPSPGMGLVTVQYPGPGNVYVSGKKFGVTNEPFEVPCGKNWHIRVASTADGPYPEWLSAGESVKIPCLEAITVQQVPGKPPPVKKKRR